jgi:hypothetical protein
MADGSPADPFAEPSEKIRGAGKWLVAAAAAVGAALFAGSQLSSIGSLPLCTRSQWQWNTQCTRLPLALLGAILGLAAVAYVMWQAARLLAPAGIPLDDLQRAWDAAPRHVAGGKAKAARADVAFFRANPAQLGGDNREPKDLEADRVDAWRALVAANKGSDDAAKKLAREQYDDMNSRLRIVLKTAQFEVLQAQFRGMLRQLLAAATVAALGIGLYSWAANPPEPTPTSASLAGASLKGADLRDADLTNVDLTDADLTGANLAGATLTGATLKDVRWSATTCPDGTSSDDHDSTCLGHLRP